jgi:hypothetical protein
MVKLGYLETIIKTDLIRKEEKSNLFIKFLLFFLANSHHFTELKKNNNVGLNCYNQLCVMPK